MAVQKAPRFREPPVRHRNQSSFTLLRVMLPSQRLTWRPYGDGLENFTSQSWEVGDDLEQSRRVHRSPRLLSRGLKGTH